MAEATRSRFSVDLDHIEQQLNQSGQQAASQKDPLAELARIVGQDDPFRALLDAGQARKPEPARQPAPQPVYEPAPVSAPRVESAPSASDYQDRWEPEWEIEPEAYHTAQPALYQGYTLRAQTPADDWGQAQAGQDAALNVYPSRHVADEASHGDYMPVDPGFGAAQPDPASYGAEPPPAAPSRPRKGLMAIGAALGVAVLGVGGTFAFRSHQSAGTAGGEPPVVKADASPVKIAPQNPGGVEIPDQNKQIYERAGQDGQTKIVSREEQPLDVRQAARVASAGGALPAGVGTPAAPQSGAINAALGEPRRVRTVAVGPDGLMKTPDQGAGRSTGGSAASSASSTPAALPPQRPRDMPSTTPQATAAAKPPAASAPEATPSAPAAPKRVAAATPQPTAEPAETGNTQTAPSGSYVVQLAVRPSEKEAKAAFSQLQQRHAGELAGKSAAIRKAEVNGGTVYRVRVGPMAKDEASSLCSRLQASGGQCFVAKN